MNKDGIKSIITTSLSTWSLRYCNNEGDILEVIMAKNRFRIIFRCGLSYSASLLQVFNEKGKSEYRSDRFDCIESCIEVVIDYLNKKHPNLL